MMAQNSGLAPPPRARLSTVYFLNMVRLMTELTQRDFLAAVVFLAISEATS